MEKKSELLNTSLIPFFESLSISQVVLYLVCYEMINHSKYCVVCYDENYLPPRRKNSRRELADYQPNSGTAVAYEYAERKNRNIINILNKVSIENISDILL